MWFSKIYVRWLLHGKRAKLLIFTKIDWDWLGWEEMYNIK